MGTKFVMLDGPALERLSAADQNCHPSGAMLIINWTHVGHVIILLH
jgi:hypothetical protein